MRNLAPVCYRWVVSDSHIWDRQNPALHNLLLLLGPDLDEISDIMAFGMQRALLFSVLFMLMSSGLPPAEAAITMAPPWVSSSLTSDMSKHKPSCSPTHPCL